MEPLSEMLKIFGQGIAIISSIFATYKTILEIQNLKAKGKTASPSTASRFPNNHKRRR